MDRKRITEDEVRNGMLLLDRGLTPTEVAMFMKIGNTTARRIQRVNELLRSDPAQARAEADVRDNRAIYEMAFRIKGVPLDQMTISEVTEEEPSEQAQFNELLRQHNALLDKIIAELRTLREGLEKR